MSFRKQADSGVRRHADGSLRTQAPRRRGRKLVLAGAILAMGATAWNWSGAQAHELTLGQSLRVLEDAASSDEALRSAATSAFLHARHAIDRIHRLSRRTDQVGADARILLERLAAETSK